MTQQESGGEKVKCNKELEALEKRISAAEDEIQRLKSMIAKAVAEEITSGILQATQGGK